jgi:hypothetical protein
MFWLGLHHRQKNDPFYLIPEKVRVRVRVKVKVRGRVRVED